MAPERYLNCVHSAHLSGMALGGGLVCVGTCRGEKDGVGCEQCGQFADATSGRSDAMDMVMPDLEQEVASIQDEGVQRFVRDMLTTAPPYFWTVPASMTGKYHPADDLGLGGLVRHVQKAVELGRKLAEVFMIEKHTDIIVAALVLHDCFKYGENNTKEGYSNHGYRMYYHIRQALEQGKLPYVTEDETLSAKVRAIGFAIMRHSGRWHGTREGKAENTIDWAVHIADVMSAHKLMAREAAEALREVAEV